MVMMLHDALYTDAQVVDNEFLSGLGKLWKRRADPKAVKTFVLSTTAPKISRLVVREIHHNPRSRKAVIKSYLTSEKPMEEFKEVAAYDFLTALGHQFPEQYLLHDEWDEGEEEGEDWDEAEGEGLFGLSGKKKGKKKKWKKIGKIALIGVAAVAAVAIVVATGGAAAPLIATAASTGLQLGQKKKAKKEQRRMEEAQAEASAYPPPGEISTTTNAAMEAVAESVPEAPVAQGGIEATKETVNTVMPQAMASYAASQVAGKSKQQLAKEIGVNPKDIKDKRIEEAEEVANGAEPSKTPGWVLPAAVGGGGLLVALAAGIF